MARLARVLAKALAACVVFLFMLGALGFMALRLFLRPEQLRELAVEHLEAALDRDVRLGGVRLSPVRGLVVDRLEISEEGGFEEGMFASAEALRLMFRWRPLLQRRLIADSLILEGAGFHLARRKDGTLNIPRLAPRKRRKETPRGAKKKPGRLPFELDVRFVEVANSRFTLRNLIADTSLEFDDIRISAEDFMPRGSFPVAVSTRIRRTVAGRPFFDITASAAGEIDLGGFSPKLMSARASSVRASGWGLDASASGAIRRFNLPVIRADASLSEKGVELARGAVDFELLKTAGRKKAIELKVAADARPAGLEKLARRLRLPEGLPAPPEVRVEAGLRLEGLSLAVRSFSASRPGLAVSAKGRVEKLWRTAEPFLDVAASAALPEIASEDLVFLRKVPPGLAIPPSKIDALLRWEKRATLFKSVVVGIADSTIGFSGRLITPSTGPARVDLHAGRIELDASGAGAVAPLTRKLGLAGSVDGSLTVEGELRHPSITGRFELKGVSGRLKGVALSGVAGRVSLAQGEVVATGLSGSAMGGRFAVSTFTIARADGSPSFFVDGDFSRLDLTALLASTGTAASASASPGGRPWPAPAFPVRPRKEPKPLVLSGRFGIGEVDYPFFSGRKFEFKWDLRNVTPDLSLIDGTASIRVASGRFESLDALCARSMIARVLLFPLLVIQKVQRLPVLHFLPDLASVGFTEIKGDYSFGGGAMTVKECRLGSPLLTLVVTGGVDFREDSLDLVATARLLKALVPLSFSVTGTLREPKVRLSPTQILLDPVRRVLDLFRTK